ncbi:MAG: hypothetical protein HY331_00495 [Chloroflexi bacterium]|nr:hypothetical protein [Chloroflexota bacterium]
MATDIFTLNATLGATIEEQVVRTLNEMQRIWDPDGRYTQYGFVRQAQTFPDVLLRRFGETPGAEPIVLGLELKGWYLLAKEGEPSFRFLVTPSACNPQDLIVVVPWVLSNVISASPRVFQPFVESARYAAEYRNYHWRYLRQTTLSTEIHVATGIRPYPRKSDRIADHPAADSGGNFGRFARTGLMDEYIDRSKSQLLCGIEARHWLTFFKVFQEQRTGEAVQRELARFGERLASTRSADESVVQSVRAILSEVEKLLVPAE